MNRWLKQGAYVVGLLLAGATGWYLAENKPNKSHEPDQDYLATVNGKGLEKDWFIEQMKLRGGLKPGQFQTVEQKKALLDVLVNEEVVYQKALAEGIDQDPTVSRLYKKTVIDKYITNTLNKKIDQVKVGNSEVESYYNQNQSIYDKPARRRAAIIVAEINQSDDDQTKDEKYQRVEKALAAIEELDDKVHHFGELAKVYSDDRASMYQGGVIGWFINRPSRQYKWDHSLIEALFELENPGDVSKIITTDDGYYIVRLVAAEKVKEKTFEQLKKGIKNQLIQIKRKQVKTEFLASLMNDADIDVNNDVLASIPTLSSGAKPKQNTPPALPAVGGAK
ncbi:MAG: peptidylprolyl isomerase [Marinicella sp.]